LKKIKIIMKRPIQEDGSPLEINDIHSIQNASKWFAKLQKALLNFVIYTGGNGVIILTPPVVTKGAFSEETKDTMTVMHHGNWLEITKNVFDHAGDASVQSFDVSTNVLHQRFGGGWQSIPNHVINRESLTKSQLSLIEEQPEIAFLKSNLPRRPSRSKYALTKKQFRYTPKPNCIQMKNKRSATSSSKRPKKQSRCESPPDMSPTYDDAIVNPPIDMCNVLVGNDVVYDWDSLINFSHDYDAM
jgi:hypothetical protein